MKNSKKVYLFALVTIAVLLGVAGSRFLNRTEVAAHPAGVPAWQAAMQSKPNAVAWKRKEIPVTTVNSKFNLNLPLFLPDTDWIIGVKPVQKGEREKMYACIVTWEDAVDREGKARGLGFKKTSKVEDYKQEWATFLDGEADFVNPLYSDQTLVIYLEIAPSTEVDVTQNGKQIILRASEGSSVIFDGEKELVKLDGPAALFNEMHMRKIQKEVTKAGYKVNITRKDMN